MPPRNDEQEVDLEEALAEAFDEMESDDSDVEEDVEETEISEEVDAEETAEADEEPVAEQEEEEVAEVSEDQELKEEIEEAAESNYTVPAPERWPEEIKEVYNGLPPEARKAMLDGIYKPMQRSYTQATQDLSSKRKALEPMLEAMNQYRNDFERMGVNPVEAFRTQVAWAAHFARVGPEQGLKDMQAAYNPGAQQEEGQQSEYLTPTERALKAQLNQLQEQVQQSQTSFQEQQRMQQQQQQVQVLRGRIENDLSSFVNEKTEDGSPAHPHVEKVAGRIAGLIRGGLVPRTDDYGQPVPVRNQIAQAYQMACNLDPSIRSAAVNTRQAAKAQAAQKVGVVTKNPVSNSGVDDDLGLDDFISKQYDTMSRRVG
jgi:hypothetical protein